MSPRLKIATRPALLAPPLRLRLDTAADRLTLYTVQSAEAIDVLLATGELRGDPALVDEYFAEAYAWLSARMHDRLGRHGTGEGMIWLWAKERRRCLVDQLRVAGAGSVLLTISIARERVQLTDFDDWHDVLNRRLHVQAGPRELVDEWWARAEPLMDEWDARVGSYRDERLHSWPSDLRAELEASWQPIVVPGPSPRAGHVQATTRVLLLEDVVRAVRVR